MSVEAGERFGSGAMFDAIAARYDLVNRVLSLGLDQGWRRRAVDAMRLAPGSLVIDLATGTGDLALMAKRRHPAAVVRGMDPSTKMLGIAREKARAALADVTFVEGDAQAIAASDGEAFGGQHRLRHSQRARPAACPPRDGARHPRGRSRRRPRADRAGAEDPRSLRAPLRARGRPARRRRPERSR